MLFKDLGSHYRPVSEATVEKTWLSASQSAPGATRSHELAKVPTEPFTKCRDNVWWRTYHAQSRQIKHVVASTALPLPIEVVLSVGGRDCAMACL